VAEEQGYFKEEGLTAYDLDQRGLIPGPLERDGLALVMREHGTDIALAVDVRAAIYQCWRNVDLFIVGGWRLDGPAGTKWYSTKKITDLGLVRGLKVGIRELGSLGQSLFTNALQRAGLDPFTDLEWVYGDHFYSDSQEKMDLLLSGEVDVVRAGALLSPRLEQAGCQMIFDPNLPGGRPGKVIVATRKTVEQRGEDLRAFFRANTRAFWFIRDVANFTYMQEVDVRMRQHSHNEFERVISLAEAADAVEQSPMPMDGGVSRPALERTIEEMAELGQLDQRVAVEEVLDAGPVTTAYQELSRRPELQLALQKAHAVVEKWGF
jgi:hypothetical protein